MEENTRLKILEWAEEDRPREKLMLKGRSSLSDAELIAILIGSGTTTCSAVDLAKIILKDTGNDLNQLATLSVSDLQKFKGIGEAKAISIISALELGRRRKVSVPAERVGISCSEDAYHLMKPHLMDISHEQFWIILLNKSNKVIKKSQVSTGGISGTVADPRIIFKIAVENLACGIILVHNHPSGNKKPSEADIQLTQRLKQAGVYLDVPVLDHLIFTDQGYYSFADEGKL
jgi:DNA repair protein RadC